MSKAPSRRSFLVSMSAAAGSAALPGSAMATEKDRERRPSPRTHIPYAASGGGQHSHDISIELTDTVRYEKGGEHTHPAEPGTLHPTHIGQTEVGSHTHSVELEITDPPSFLERVWHRLIR